MQSHRDLGLAVKETMVITIDSKKPPKNNPFLERCNFLVRDCAFSPGKIKLGLVYLSSRDGHNNAKVVEINMQETKIIRSRIGYKLFLSIWEKKHNIPKSWNDFTLVFPFCVWASCGGGTVAPILIYGGKKSGWYHVFGGWVAGEFGGSHISYRPPKNLKCEEYVL